MISAETEDDHKLTEVWSCKISKQDSKLYEDVIWLLKRGGVLKWSASESEFMRQALKNYAQQALDGKLKPQ